MDDGVLRRELHGVVEQVQHRAFECVRVARQHPGLQVGLEIDRPGSAPSPVERAFDHLDEIDTFRGVRGAVFARQLGEVADELGDLVELRADVRFDVRAVPSGQRGRPLAARGEEQFEVRAQGRERRAQLVTGIGHQPTLPISRLRDRRQHRVEALRHPSEFVVAAHGDRPQVHAARDALRRRGQPLHRTQPRPGDRRSRRRSHQNPGSTEEQQHQRQLAESPLGGGERLGEHHRDAVARGQRDDPHVGALVGPQRRVARPVGDGEFAPPPRGRGSRTWVDELPPCREEPDVDVTTDQERARHGLQPGLDGRALHCGLRAVQQVLVELRVQIAVHRDVGTE